MFEGIPADLEAKHESETDLNATTTAIVDLFDDGSVDPVYRAKAYVLNAAMQEIGMGKYQWCLFVVSGFGWFTDIAWATVGGYILSPVVNEFHFNAPLLSLSMNIGVFVGASLWGLVCDIWGRRWPFNVTLFFAGAFGIAAGGSPNFLTLASLFAVVGFGIGGNLSVDSAVFLDFIPASHQYMLPVLSIWSSIAHLLSALVAWPFIANFSCPLGPRICTRAENMGWRYLLFTLGGVTLLLWAIRFFVFRLEESPRLLVGLGRDADAVEVMQRIAKFNGRECTLRVDHLARAGDAAMSKGSVSEGKKSKAFSPVFTTEHIKNLFKTPKMAWSMTLLITIWSMGGLALTLYGYFLPFLLASRGAKFGDSSYYITYRNQVILAVIQIPASFLAGWATEQPYIGRKGTLAISAVLTGAFLFASTTARSSNALLGWNCGYIFNNLITSAVLFSVTAELFPAKDRSTGNGLASVAFRLVGVIGPIIAMYANLETTVPVYVSGGLAMSCGVLALLLPYEPLGKASI